MYIKSADLAVANERIVHAVWQQDAAQFGDSFRIHGVKVTIIGQSPQQV